MEEFLSDIVSPYWLLSVVLVSLIMTVIGNFLSKWIEKLFSKYTSKYRQRNLKQLKEYKSKVNEGELLIENFIDKLNNNPVKLSLHLNEITRLFNFSIGYMIISLIIFIMAILFAFASFSVPKLFWFFTLSGFLLAFLAYSSYKYAAKLIRKAFFYMIIIDGMIELDDFYSKFESYFPYFLKLKKKQRFY